MILTLLFVSIVVVGLVIYIIGSCVIKRAWELDYGFSDCGDIMCGIGGVTAGVAGIAIFFSLLIIVVNQNPIHSENLRIDYEQNVAGFEATRKAIIERRDDYAKSDAITTYNIEVTKFKTKILQAQKQLNNLWINWFTPSVYGDFDANVVSYIE